MEQDWDKLLRLISNPRYIGYKPALKIPINSKPTRSYTIILARYPWIVIILTVILVTISAVISTIFYDLPDFSDPQKGFEPRGTAVSNRYISWDNLVKSTRDGEELSLYPTKYAQEINENYENELDDSSFSDYSEINEEYERAFNSSYESNVEYATTNKSFCFSSHSLSDMAKMVFGPTANVNLFTVSAMKSMCSLEEELIALDSPCLSWSLGNSVAVFNGKSSCLNITDEDVDKMLETLLNCEGYYNDGTLHDDCWQTSQCSVPTYCAKYNIVYNIFHFLTSINFKPSEGTVKTAITVLPVYRYNDDLIEIFQKSFPDGKPVSDGISTVTSLDFEIKSDIFSDYLLEDSKYGVIAACTILLFMWLYIGSIFIVLMAVLSMFFSLIFAYFIYTVVLQIFFFPFMNMLAFVLLIAIGADDAFVYCDIWKHTKQANAQSTKESIIGKALRHGFLTMFVTSFTTAAALFANIVNPITSIRCFSIYTGIAILCNFILTVTWLPAAVSLHDICSAFLCCKEHSPIMKNLLVSTCCTGVRKISFFFTETGRIFFDKLLPWLVIKFRYLWLIMLSLFTIGGFIVVFVTPKLSLPTVNDLQLFTSSHLLETYQLKYKDRFHFENVQNKEIYGQAPVRVVFGIEANDNGDYLDPDNFGNVTFTSTFDVSTAASQEWLLNFCAQLRNQSFILTSQGVQIENCLIETFKWWMDSRSCERRNVQGDLINMSPCCQQSSFPYDPETFTHCLKVAILELDSNPYFSLFSNSPGVRFGENDTIKAIILEFESIYSWTYSYDIIKTFWDSADSWISKQIKMAPAGLRHGWFVSNVFDFFALQESLSSGTIVALLTSLAIVFIVMLLTTRNILLSMYSLLSILGIIVVTVASLVLLGWELNIFESISVSIAVGLSIDFTVHYSVAYKLASNNDRESRVVFSISQMGSAITMASFTTFVTGALMMSSSVLIYSQLGTFLMLIISVSWFYSTFYFQSLCRMLGPQGEWGQIPLPCHWCGKKQSSRSLETHELPALVVESGCHADQIVGIDNTVKTTSNRPVQNADDSLLQTSSSINEPAVLPNTCPDTPDIWIKIDHI